MRLVCLFVFATACTGSFELKFDDFDFTPTPATEPASGGVPSTPTDPIDAAPDCEAYEYRGDVYNCATVDYCDSSADNLRARLACCECDPVLCQPADCHTPGEPGPGPLPQDEGPPIFFAGSFDGPIQAAGSFTDLWMTLSSTPAGFLVSAGQGAAVEEVTCSRTNNTYTCAPFTVRAASGEIEIDLFQLLLLDDDGDGAADDALVRLYGGLRTGPPNYGVHAISEIAVFSRDSTPPSVVIDAALPGGRVSFATSEPLGLVEPLFLVDGIASDADGTDLAFDTLVGGSSTTLPLDWGSVVALNQSADLAGNAVLDTAVVVSDPGPALANAGFEGVGGWEPATSLYPDGLVGLPPGSGTGFAMFNDGALVGAMEVGTHQQLGFMYATFGEFVPFARLRIVRPDGSSNVVWEMPDANAVPCQTVFPGQCIPWDTALVDISDYAGERVFLRWESGVSGFPTVGGAPPPPPPLEIGRFALDEVVLLP